MSAGNELIVLTGVTLLTAVVQRGTADTVVRVAMEAGAQGATVFHAHGSGIRQERMGILWLTRLEKMATHIPPDIAARFGVHKEQRE
jgi:hypothetical protein